MSNKTRKILNGDIDNYSKLQECLNSNSTSTIEDIFNTLKRLINNNDRKNDKRINKLFSIVENSIDNLNSENIDKIVIHCLNLKQCIKLKNNNFISKIDRLLDNVCYENSEQYRFDIMKSIEYLIYKDKNIERLKILLNNIDKSYRSSMYYDDIFKSLLYNFDTSDRELKKYYYKASILLLEKMNDNLLIKNKDRYLSILDNLKIHSEYTDDLVNLISGNYIDDTTLASRFNVNLNFPYTYSNVNIMCKDNDIPNLKQGAITIDNENTIKKDDAIYFKKNKDNTYTLYVHVSYIPAIIPYDSDINKMARSIGKSFCISSNIIPIYPKEFVLNNCSLDKGKYKNVVTYSLKLDKDLSIIPDTLKITRTNVSINNNYSYNGINDIIKNNNNDDLSTMLKYLTIFTFNNINSNNLDVERLIGDNDFYKELLINNNDRNIAQEMIQYIMKIINHNSAKYFRDRELPYLYKYSYLDEDNLSSLNKEYSNNRAMQRKKILLNELDNSFLKIKLSEKPKQFFEFDCYSSSTDPLWKYSSSYNQYLIDKFIFNKDYGTELKNEWYNNTRVLAEELNLRKDENKDMEIISKRLSRMRKKI